MSMQHLPSLINLPGPSTLTHEYMVDLVTSLTLRPASIAPVLPKFAALFLAKFSKFVWWPSLSTDEVIRRYLDDVAVPGDWDAVGVTPSEIENHAITYVRQYRSGYVHTQLFFGILLANVTFPGIQSQLCSTGRRPSSSNSAYTVHFL